MKTHCEISKKRTNYHFKELHRWIDEYQDTLGKEHRAKRHFWNIKTEKHIKEVFDKKQPGMGNIAVEEWLFHIAIDNLHTLQKKLKHNHPMKQTPNFLLIGFSDDDMIFYDDDSLEKPQLKAIFRDISRMKRR